MSYHIDLSGRVALVTGAPASQTNPSGLGAQFARTLARSGAAVVLAGRRTDRLKTVGPRGPCAPRSKARAATPMWWNWT